MSWLFSQALVEEYLGDISLDGEQSVPLSGNNTQQAYCAPDKMTKFSRLSRFGMTYKPLMESLGEELLTLYLADFHAKTLAQQGGGGGTRAADHQCGSTWQGSLARLDPDTSLWRTAQCSLLEDLELSLQTFPKWGLMQNGALYPQQTLVRRISESVFGFSLPTPVSSDATSGAVIGKNDTFYTTSTGMPRKVNQNGKDGSVGLGRLVQMWPTPMSSEHKANRQTRENHQNGLTQAVLQAETKMLPTPCNRDYKGAVKSGKRITKSGKTQNYGEQLPNVIGGQLNPTWVEWLMGWPLGWTDLKPLEMDKSLYVQQQHGNY
jgi:hypothetical protein